MVESTIGNRTIFNLKLMYHRCLINLRERFEKAIVAHVSWILSVRGVQYAIACQLHDGGALCHALREAVDYAVNNMSIEVDAADVRNLDNTIASYVEDNINDIADEVAKELTARLRG